MHHGRIVQLPSGEDHRAGHDSLESWSSDDRVDRTRAPTSPGFADRRLEDGKGGKRGPPGTLIAAGGGDSGGGGAAASGSTPESGPKGGSKGGGRETDEAPPDEASKKARTG